MDISVVIGTRNKVAELRRTLQSIFKQKPNHSYEVIVVDDGTEGPGTYDLCQAFSTVHSAPIRYYRLKNNEYRNPGIARNFGYKRAVGNVLVLQSDDVVHVTSEALNKLADITPGTFNVATVYNATPVQDSADNFYKRECYTGQKNKRPLFFLGSVLRKDIYAIGGNCEEFTEPGYEDDWLSKCLTRGLGLEPVYRDDVLGYHQDHPRPLLREPYKRMAEIFKRKFDEASADNTKWIGGEPWSLATEDERV